MALVLKRTARGLTDCFHVLLSPDGNWLAVGEWDRGDGLSVWDLRTRQEVASFTKFGIQVYSALSPRQPLLAFSSITHSSSNAYESKIKLWIISDESK